MSPEGFQSRPIAGNGGAGTPVRPVSVRPPYKRATRSARSWLGGAGGGQEHVVKRLWRRFWEIKEELGWKRLILRTGGVGTLLVILYVGFLWFTLPVVNDQTILRASQSTAIVDRNGTELYRVYGEQNRTIVKKEDISQHVKDAVVAIEDQRFFTRGCLDVRAIVRSLVTAGRKGGASTLTRQLARNALNLQRENILNRKLKELMLGCQMEAVYSRDDLLALYLNWIPFGQNAYGVQQASQTYFGKNAKDLTIAESAILASIPRGPSYYNPYGRHVRTTVTEDVLARISAGKITKTSQLDDDDVSIGLMGGMLGTGSHLLYVGGRTDQVLENMVSQGMITDAERTEAVTELKTITFQPSRESIRAAHFVLWTKDQVEKMFQSSADKGILEQGGLTIQTTLDWELQQAAEKAVTKFRESHRKIYMAQNIALVAMDPVTKEILAYVGNADYSDQENEGKVDMALAPRAPGSTFKPLIYASAFLKGYGPATVLHDVKTKFGDYEPQNFEGGFWGITTIRKALGGSRNIPAIKAYFLGGEEDALLSLASSMGVTTPLLRKPAEGYGPSMAIGAAETPLLEMVQGYATLADGGLFKPAVSIRKITDVRGALLPIPGDFDPGLESKEVLDPRVAYEVTSILSDKTARPGEYWQSILSVAGTEAAAKTGTSNKCLEFDEKKNCKPGKRKPDNVWTVGYTPMIVAGVWAGNATSDPLSDKADGINVAAPIWKEFMSQAQKIFVARSQKENLPLKTAFDRPDGLLDVQASLLSGELPTECTPVEMRKSDVFLRENAPTLADPACVTIEVDKVTGLLASDSCPAEARETKSFYVPKSILADRWPSWEQGVQTWAKEAGSGANLPLPIAPTEACDISMTPGRLEKPSIRLLTPGDGGTASYPSFHPTFDAEVGSSIREVTFEIDGKHLETFTGAPFDGAVRVPRSISEAGMHELTVTLTDEYYNTAKDTVRFSFRNDSGGPSVRLISPEAGASVPKGTEVSMQAVADDTEGGIKYVEFYLDGILLTRKPKSPYELTYPIDNAGTHRIRAVAVDLAGNTTEDEIRIEVTDGSGSSSSAH